MKNKFGKFIYIAMITLGVLLFIIYVGGPQLKDYVEEINILAQKLRQDYDWAPFAALIAIMIGLNIRMHILSDFKTIFIFSRTIVDSDGDEINSERASMSNLEFRFLEKLKEEGVECKRGEVRKELSGHSRLLVREYNIRKSKRILDKVFRGKN